MANIPTKKKDNTAAYITLDNSNPVEFAKASAAINKAYESIMPIDRSGGMAKGAIANRFQNIDGNTSVRDGFSRLDYDFFRPNEAMPKRFRDIIFACNGSYEKIAIVREVIDMMGDFGSAGIRIVHPNPSIERFYQAWFNEIGGEERSERLLNYLYRMGNVIVKRSTGKLKADVVQTWKRAMAKSGAVVEDDLKYEDKPKFGKMEVPLRYTFLNPIVLEVIGEEIAAFTGKVHFALKLPVSFYRSLNLPLTSFDPAILTEELPRDIQGALNSSDRWLVLDPAKLITCYYKRDDWNVWAYPMLYSLLDDLILFQKMKLADLTALDGVISHIRVWKLGSLEHKIWPNDSAIQKLSSILLNHTAGGAIDLIWGPDIEIQETSTDVYKFLGGEKYQAVMAHIHQGLGIPTSLSGGNGTFSDNMISLRTLIERLKYGRNILKTFWENEMKMVQVAMGFRYPAQIVFDNMNLHDETAEKALWIQLVDRDIISIESLQEKFGQIPEIEQIRLKRQYKEIANKQMPERVSPYHDAQPDLSLEKIFAQRGVVTPSQVGLDLGKPKSGEKNAIEMQGDIQLKAIEMKPAPTGVSGQGRPTNSKDTKKRKKRTVNPRSTAQTISELTIYSNKLQKLISDVINPYFLDKFSKSSDERLSKVLSIIKKYAPVADLYSIGWNKEQSKVIVSNGDWAEYDTSSLYKELEKYLGSGNVSMDAEISIPEDKNWERIDLQLLTRAAEKTGPGCLMVPINAPLTNKIQKWSKKFIPDNYLYVEQDAEAESYDNYGREERSHVTVVYGFVNNSEQEIRKYIRENYSDITFTLGDVGKFEKPNFDVIKINVESDQLKQLHKDLVIKFNVKETFDEYRPHVTIAYVQKGFGNDLIGSESFAGKKISVSEFIYSEGEGMVEIKSKKNLRMLTKAEYNEMENFKLALMFNIKPYTVAEENDLVKILDNPIVIHDNVKALINQMVVDFTTKFESQPNVEDMKNIVSLVYAAFNMEEENHEGKESTT